jgi:ACR3 family arsenite transporter
MYAISIFFLGVLFKNFVGIEATDLVKIPLGANWQVSPIDIK